MVLTEIIIVPIFNEGCRCGRWCQQTELLESGSCLKDNLRLDFLEFGGTFSGGGSAMATSSSPAVDVIVGLPWRLSGTVRKFLRGVINPVELDRMERIWMGPSPDEDDESLAASRDKAEPPKPCMRSVCVYDKIRTMRFKLVQRDLHSEAWVLVAGRGVCEEEGIKRDLIWA